MRACLEGRGGEVSARNRAAELGRRPIWTLDDAGRTSFLRMLAGFDSDPRRGRPLLRGGAGGGGPGASGPPPRRALRRALEPPRLRLLTQFTAIPDGMQVPGRSARLLLTVAQGDPLLRGARGRSARAARQLVRCRLSRAAADRLGQPRRAAGKAGRLRGGARDPLLARPEEPARFRPPLLRLLPSAHAGRAADLRRGGAGAGPRRQRAAAAGSRRRRCSTRERADTAIFYSISNCQRGPRRHQLRQFPHQARGRAAGDRISATSSTFATLSPIPGFRRMAGDEAPGRRAGSLVGGGGPSLSTAAPAELPAPDARRAGAAHDSRPARLVPRPGHAAGGRAGADAALRPLPADRGSRRSDPRDSILSRISICSTAPASSASTCWATPPSGACARAPRSWSTISTTRRGSRTTTRIMPARGSAMPPPLVRRMARGWG